MFRHLDKSRFLKKYLEDNWPILPVVSSLLFVASSYPFNLWPLSLIALAPYFYFVYFSEKISLGKLFAGGFFFGFIICIIFSSFTLAQFHWFPETYLFVWAVKTIGLPISIIGGLAWGIISVLIRILRFSPIMDIFTMSAIYVGIEWLILKLFWGYNLARIAYPLHDIQFIVGMSSIGGVVIASFIVALINAFIAAFFIGYAYRYEYPNYSKKLAVAAITTISALVIIYSLNHWYLNGSGQTDKKEVTFAIIQFKGDDEKFGKFKNGNFSFPALEKSILEAEKLKPDFIVYPFSLTGSIIPIEESNEFLIGKNIRNIIAGGNISNISEWLSGLISPSTVFASWNTVVSDNIYEEIDFWQNGKVIQNYQKRKLFPFIDYTPEFSKKMGLYTVPIDAVPGPNGQISKIGDLNFNNLICSEITNSDLARENAGKTNIIFSPGSEAVFRGDTMGNVDLVSAQFRAAENHSPLVRANRFGPSAIIDSNGNILKRTYYQEEGILFGKVSYQKNSPRTLYSIWGDWMPIGADFLFIAVVLFFKLSHKNYLKKLR